MLSWETKKVWLCAFLTVFMFLPAFAGADDVIDSINEGLEYYKKGEHTSAVESLNYAAQLIQQMKGEGLESFLPAPLSGWKAEPASSQAAAAAMMGGGVAASRQYNKGSSSVDVQIIADAPMLQGMIMMFSNPMLATADGGKLERIKGEKAIVKYDAANRDGQIQIVVANRFFIVIEGNEVSKDDLQGYAKGIDYKKLAALP
jgi:hypothetical protein